MRSNSANNERGSRRGPAGSAGFTILEVLISMAVMIMIAFAIYQATTETYRIRDVLQNEGDFYNGIRMAMDIMQRDVNLIYSPAIMMPPKPMPSGLPGQAPPPPDPATAKDMEAIMSSDLGQTTQFWEGATDSSAVRSSRFIGTDVKMSFISLSHVRIYKDSKESEFAQVAYSYDHDPDKDLPKDMEGTNILVKTENANAFEEDEGKQRKTNHVYPLLHGLKKFKLSYYRKDKDRWESSWDSDKEDFKNLYPDEIKVTIEVHGPTRLFFEGSYIFRPEVPLRGLAVTF
jgi:general secretion pathway protein J